MREEERIWIGVASSSPLGPVWVAVGRRGLVAVEIRAEPVDFKTRLRKKHGREACQNPELTSSAVQQVQEYLAGERIAFDLPIDWGILTQFQQAVLEQVAAVPYGEVTTYGEIARRIGRSRAARAVGWANASNPMPLVLPCHRLVGHDGHLRGYGAPGGLDTKAWLQTMEKGKW